jgi:hypothetical protein
LAAKERDGGPLLLSRSHFDRRKMVPSTPATKQDIIQEYRRRLGSDCSAQRRLQMLALLLDEVGAVTYDQLSREFHHIARKARLSQNITLKSLRHHFAEAMEKANISYFTRKYFMGHRVRRDPLAIYTTTDVAGIRREFNCLLDGPFALIVESATRRMEQLGFSGQ